MRSPFLVFFFGFGQEGYLQFRETPPLLVQMSKTDFPVCTPGTDIVTIATVPIQSTPAST